MKILFTHLFGVHKLFKKNVYLLSLTFNIFLQAQNKQQEKAGGMIRILMQRETFKIGQYEPSLRIRQKYNLQNFCIIFDKSVKVEKILILNLLRMSYNSNSHGVLPPE